MRKISKEISTAFLQGEAMRNGNTSTDGKSYSLHGNEIAIMQNGRLFVTLAGWNTATTRERLNALPGVRVTTKLGQAYLNGRAWDGSLSIIGEFDE